MPSRAGKPAVLGEMAVAEVKSGGKSHGAMEPNQACGFQRIYVQPKETLSVEMVYPEGKAGQTVVLEAEDGGKFDDDAPVKAVNLDAGGRLAFNFTVI